MLISPVMRLPVRSPPVVMTGRFQARMALSPLSPTLFLSMLGFTAAMWTVSAQTVAIWGATNSPPPITGPVIAVSAGSGHFVALRSDETLFAWGSSLCGQTNVPYGLHGVIAVAAGEYHNLALRFDGSVRAWGCDTPWGADQVPASVTNVVQVAVGQRHSLALRSDGAVMAWGDNGVGQCDVPDNLHGVAIAGGGLFSVAVERNRTVAAWGDDFLGQCRPPDGLEDVVAVAAGSHHALALRTDGTVVAWGDNSCGQCDIPVGLTGVSAITAAATYSLALRADGTVVAWGQPVTVQPPPDLTNVVAIAAADDSALALVDAEGPFLVRAIGDLDAVLGAEITLTAAVHGSPPLVFQWYKGVQPLADSERISGTATQNLVIQEARLEDTDEYSLLARNAGGIVVTPAAQMTVFAAPRIEKQPESLSSSSGSEALLSASAAGAGPLAYQWFKDGTALIDNERVSGAGLQQLRIGSLVLGDAGEYSVVVSNAHGSVMSRVAHVTVTQVAGWGENWCGELDVPADLTGVVKVAAGEAHALALRDDGTVIAWGDNLHGQCDVPEDLNEAVAIAAGGFHSLALRRNGNVVGWGYSKGGLLDVPPGLDSVTAIAAGMGHSIALRGDGTVRCWGLTRPAAMPSWRRTCAKSSGLPPEGAIPLR